ncbi:unnamed protein product [Linum tenue]|uniref:non-specific serine/threonine protein kinase n=1 Tax=Linum tenue TaxID=586396 RepID=A0AAV0P826_9ROSI|nr:unnamed protein product [Linum tenue]
MGAPAAKELLRKVQELEAGQAELQKEMTRLLRPSSDQNSENLHEQLHRHPPPRSRFISPPRERTGRRFEKAPATKKSSPPPFRHSSPLERDSRRPSCGSGNDGGERSAGPSAVKHTDKQYLNILQSMGQSVHIFDFSGRLIYWNRGAEKLYGYSAAEAFDGNIVQLLVDPGDRTIAQNVVDRVLQGESWTGQFPVKTKSGDRFPVVATNTPFYDDEGTLIGLICSSMDSRPFHEVKAGFSGPFDTEAVSSSSNCGVDRTCSSVSAELGMDSQLPLQATLKSKISNLATKVSNKVKSKIQTGENNSLDCPEGGSGDGHHSDHGFADVAAEHRDDANSSGAGTPRASSRRGDFHPSSSVVSPSGDDSEGKPAILKVITSKAEVCTGKKGLSCPWKGYEREVPEARMTKFVWPWSQHDQEGEMNRPSNAWSLSSGNVNSRSCVSSCGSTSSSTGNRIDVEPDSWNYDILWEDLTIGEQIREGIPYEKTPPSKCAALYGCHVLTTASLYLYRVLTSRKFVSVTATKSNKTRVEAESADGLGYSLDNLLSSVCCNRHEVGDFGLSRLKHETFLTTKSGKGTPQWMAPEVLRNERSDEKSDIYSFGVILWELATKKIPWDNLNSMQIVGAVGFMNQRLDIPKDLDPRWASIIESCWLSDPASRPTFQELLKKLRDLQRQYAVQLLPSHSPPSESYLPSQTNRHFFRQRNLAGFPCSPCSVRSATAISAPDEILKRLLALPSMDAPTPPTEELLRKIQELEAGQAELQQEMVKLLKLSSDPKSEDLLLHQHEQHHHHHYHHHPPPRSQSVSPQRRQGTGRSFEAAPAAVEKKTSPPPFRHSSSSQRDSRLPRSGSSSDRGGRSAGPSALKFSDKQYLNILQSLGQSVHIFDLTGSLIYWNRGAENLYGYSAAEVLGRNLIGILVDPRDSTIAQSIIDRVFQGESWTGQFPVKTKSGDRFTVVATDTPFYDDDGTLIGLICVSADSRPFYDAGVDFSGPVDREAVSDFSNRGIRSSSSFTSLTAKLGLDSQQPLQAAFKSKISNLATKVSNKMKSKIRTGENSVDHREGGSGDSHHSDHGLGDIAAEHRDDANSSGASTPRASSPKRDFHPPPSVVSPPGDESEGKPAIHKIITSKAEEWMGKKGLPWPWKGNEREVSEARTSKFVWPWLQNDQEGEMNYSSSGSWSSSANVHSTSSSSCGSTSSTVNRLDVETDSLDYDILWEDLTIGEQIGQGSCGTVYHALWYGSDVAVKVFSKQEYSDDVILSFRQERKFVSVTPTKHNKTRVETESADGIGYYEVFRHLLWYHLLQQARGMNYLHHFNPPIVHRDLKSSNLLVDRNWTVKVGDFGLSRLKHETFLTTKSGKGTPQWMAPEVLRNERSDEKSDIYSFGVVLWELATEKIPWHNLNSMQVIGAVGFMNQRLEIPKDLDPRWASIIESCWLSDPASRPTFQELLDKLRDLQRQYNIQLQAARSTTAAAGEHITLTSHNGS